MLFGVSRRVSEAMRVGNLGGPSTQVVEVEEDGDVLT